LMIGFYADPQIANKRRIHFFIR